MTVVSFFGWRTVEMSRCGCDLGGREWRKVLPEILSKE